VHISWTTITSSIVGSRVESVVCEKCGTSFFYKLVRAGIGKGSAPYDIGLGQALTRSQTAAQNNLDYRLSGDVELIACPHCNWVNQEIVEKYRSRKYCGVLYWSLLVLIVGFVTVPMTVIFLTSDLSYDNPWRRKIALLMTTLWFSSPVWFLVGQWIRRHRINPNANFPEYPILLPGTPPALVEQIDPKTGQKQWVPATPAQELPADGAIFRPAQLQPPDLCCVCMSTPDKLLTPPTKHNKYGGIKIPICNSCVSRLKRRRLMLSFVFIAVSSALVGGLFWFKQSLDAVGTIKFILIESILSVIACFLIAHFAFRPYSIRVLDKDRGILKISSLNPQYTSMLIKQAAESDRQIIVHPLNTPQATTPTSSSCYDRSLNL
jgi:hypothetical protein